MGFLKHDVALRLVKALDAVLVTAPFALCWLLYYAGRTASPYYARGNYLVVALVYAGEYRRKIWERNCRYCFLEEQT